MIGLAIIADDLTGALDAASPFAALDGGVVVATRPQAIATALEAHPAVLSVSTRSRDLPPEDARDAVATALSALPEGVRLFKKIDSRLKGRVEAELTAFKASSLLFAPAIPEFGRIVRDGALEGFGIDKPVPVRGALGEHAVTARVPDTATDIDMDRALAEATDDALLVGARGLAAALARRMGAQPPSSAPPLPHPLCIAAGSSDPITLVQIAELRAALPKALHVTAPAGIGVATAPHPLPPVTILQATPGPETPPDAVARNFAGTTKAWLAEARSLVLTGGATAEACLDTLGIDTLRITGEPIPGMPVCTSGGKSIVTKSGGFGEPDALLRLAGASQMTEV